MNTVRTIGLSLLALALDWGRNGASLAEARAATGAPIPAAPHVQYYGLWDVSAGDFGFESSLTYIDETAPFSNVVFINPRPDVDPEARARSMNDLRNLVQSALRRDLKVIVSVRGHSGLCDVPYPRESVETYLAQVSDVMAPYRDALVAFFLDDEPYLVSYKYCPSPNSVSPYPVIYNMDGAIARASTADNPSVYERLDHVARTLHRLMPGVPVALNNSYVDADPEGWGAFGFDPTGTRFWGFLTSMRKLEIPPTVDWIGMDQYLNSARPIYFGDVDLGFDPVSRRLDMLLARKTPAQRLFLIPDAMILSGSATEKDVVNRMQRFQAYAAAHPEVIGVFPYYYWTMPPDQVGMQDLPEVFSEHRRWGMQITGKDGQKVPGAGTRVLNTVNQMLLLDDSLLDN